MTLVTVLKLSRKIQVLLDIKFSLHYMTGHYLLHYSHVLLVNNIAHPKISERAFQNLIIIGSQWCWRQYVGDNFGFLSIETFSYYVADKNGKIINQHISSRNYRLQQLSPTLIIGWSKMTFFDLFILPYWLHKSISINGTPKNKDFQAR